MGTMELYLGFIRLMKHPCRKSKYNGLQGIEEEIETTTLLPAEGFHNIRDLIIRIWCWCLLLSTTDCQKEGGLRHNIGCCSGFCMGRSENH